jgi:hypothetical protein
MKKKIDTKASVSSDTTVTAEIPKKKTRKSKSDVISTESIEFSNNENNILTRISSMSTIKNDKNPVTTVTNVTPITPVTSVTSVTPVTVVNDIITVDSSTTSSPENINEDIIINSSNLPEVKIPKKRGRKPKNKEEEPSQIQSDNLTNITIDDTSLTPTVVPDAPVKLKRGRKPKLKQAENINKFSDLAKTTNVSNDTMILKLHIDSAFDTKENDIHKNEDREKEFLNYKGDVESPTGYANYDSFMSNPEMIDFKNEELITGAYNNQSKNKYKNVSENNDSVCHVHTILENFVERDNWPIGTDSACFWCCNSFSNTPFGIPFKYANEKFMVYGCFCSLECATAYNFSTQNNVHNIWENYSLINLLAHKLNYKNYVKSAPPREALIMFGGYMTIQKFREFCGTNKLLNILNYPMISSQHQVEEISDQSINNNSRMYVPLDTDRIKKIQQKFKLIRQKPVLNKKNTLEHTMNLKIKSEIDTENGNQKISSLEISNEIIS